MVRLPMENQYAIVSLRHSRVLADSRNAEFMLFVMDNLAAPLEALDADDCGLPAINAWLEARTEWFRYVRGQIVRGEPPTPLRHWERETRNEACDE
jgi:hypothetical protein